MKSIPPIQFARQGRCGFSVLELSEAVALVAMELLALGGKHELA